MNELTYNNYQQYKEALDNELTKSVESFVKIGYLLKVARDTNILFESGYKNIYEFAQAEYSLDKSAVSRFININDRFSEGGYSASLVDKYQGFGYAKLSLMLTLPDYINDELGADYSKAEIGAIKEQYEEESKVTDIEVVLEATEIEEQSDNLTMLIKSVFENTELYLRYAQLGAQATDEELLEVIAPSGVATLIGRVVGVGRLMLTINGMDSLVITNMRSGEKEIVDWQQLKAQLIKPATYEEPQKAWEQLYGKSFPQEEKKEPRQYKTSGIEPPKAKQNKVVSQPKKDKKNTKITKKEEKKRAIVETPPKNEGGKPCSQYQTSGIPAIEESENEKVAPVQLDYEYIVAEFEQFTKELETYAKDIRFHIRNREQNKALELLKKIKVRIPGMEEMIKNEGY